MTPPILRTGRSSAESQMPTAPFLLVDAVVDGVMRG
jgi:hypothetical protein